MFSTLFRPYFSHTPYKLFRGTARSPESQSFGYNSHDTGTCLVHQKDPQSVQEGEPEPTGRTDTDTLPAESTGIVGR